MADHIKIGDIAPRIQYAGDGSQTAFTYPFPIFVDADIEIYVDDALQTITTHYTVFGAGNDTGGSITFVTPPTASETVTLVRNLVVQRESDFQESGEFSAKVINDELDKIIAMLQEIEDELGRGLFLSPTDTASSLTLPNLTDRTGAYLAFDGSGDPIAAADPGSYPASAFMGTVLDDTDATAARTTLGLTIDSDVLSPGGDGSGLTGIVTGDAWGDAVDANVVPDADSARNLGSATKAFAELYIDTLFDGVTGDSVAASYLVHGVAKTWATYNMVTTSTVLESFNVTSITDNGTGDATINLTSDMATATGSAVVSSWNTADGGSTANAASSRGAIGGQIFGGAVRSASSVRIQTLIGAKASADGAVTDSSENYLALHGDLA